jgi:hypothetical protein
MQIGQVVCNENRIAAALEDECEIMAALFVRSEHRMKMDEGRDIARVWSRLQHCNLLNFVNNDDRQQRRANERQNIECVEQEAEIDFGRRGQNHLTGEVL